MGTKREGVPCYDKADMDEPIFVLRAQDGLAIETIAYWISRLAYHRDSSNEKLNAAMQDLEKFKQWQEQNPHRVKIPD